MNLTLLMLALGYVGIVAGIAGLAAMAFAFVTRRYDRYGTALILRNDVDPCLLESQRLSTQLDGGLLTDREAIECAHSIGRLVAFVTWEYLILCKNASVIMRRELRNDMIPESEQPDARALLNKLPEMEATSLQILRRSVVLFIRTSIILGLVRTGLSVASAKKIVSTAKTLKADMQAVDFKAVSANGLKTLRC